MQRIKELVTKIGSLEFRILANQHDDAKAIDDAKKLINSVKIGEEMQGRRSGPGQSELQGRRREAGLPPPTPRLGNE